MANLFRIQLMSVLAFSTIANGASGRASMTIPVRSDECQEAGAWVSGLRSEDPRHREIAKKSILGLANRSSTSRRCVIKKTLKIVTDVTTAPDKGVELFWRSPARFQEWAAAADILATINAVEAIDVLVDCLDCNDGRYGLGIGRFPAARAVVKFGNQAIAKLETALQYKPPGTRVMAVRALRLIGGERARLILLKALKSETDKQVVDTINSMLVSWNSSGMKEP